MPWISKKRKKSARDLTLSARCECASDLRGASLDADNSQSSLTGSKFEGETTRPTQVGTERSTTTPKPCVDLIKS